MNEAQFEKDLFPEDIAMSPRFVWNRFKTMIDTYGEDTIVSNRLFKKAREMQITALFLNGLSLATGREYWLYPEHNENTPDTYGFWITDHENISGARVKNLMNIEVSLWENNKGLPLLETIKEKLKNKKYPGYYILLIHAVRKSGEIVDLEKVSLELDKLKLSVSEIFLISAAKLKNGKDHLLARLYGKDKKVQIEFSPSSTIESITKNNIDLLKNDLPRGKGEIYVVKEYIELKLPEII